MNKSLGATTIQSSGRVRDTHEAAKLSIGTQRGWKRLLLSYIGSDVPRAIRGLRRRHKLQPPGVNILLIRSRHRYSAILSHVLLLPQVEAPQTPKKNRVASHALVGSSRRRWHSALGIRKGAMKKSKGDGRREGGVDTSTRRC